MARIVACVVLLFCIESSLAQMRESPSVVQQKLISLANQTPEVIAYAAFLDSLDLTNPESNLKAAFAMFEQFDSSSAAVKDDAFRLFYALYIEDIYRSTQWISELEWIPENGQSARYRICGIKFGACEGEAYAEIDADFVLKCLDGLDRDSHYRIWMETYTRAHQYEWCCDGGCVGGERARELIVSLESSAKHCFDIPEVSETLSEDLSRLIPFYISGADNSPVFPWNGGPLLPEIKSSWEKYMSENRNSIFFPMMRDAYGSLAETGFVKNPAYTEIAAKNWEFGYIKGLVDEMLKKEAEKK